MRLHQYAPRGRHSACFEKLYYTNGNIKWEYKNSCRIGLTKTAQRAIVKWNKRDASFEKKAFLFNIHKGKNNTKDYFFPASPENFPQKNLASLH